MFSFDQIFRRELPGMIARLTGLRVLQRPRPDPPIPEGPDFVVHAGGRIFVAEFNSSSRSASVLQAARRALRDARDLSTFAIPLVAVPHMGEAGARVCSEEGVGYLDLSGNAHLEAPGLHIHVEGRPRRFTRRGRPSSPFAPKSSRVARTLLLYPDQWWSQKNLALETRLGAGFVSRIVRRLEDDDLLERDASRRVRPRSPDLLLEAWRQTYDFMKHEILALHVAARNGPELMERIAKVLVSAGLSHAFTGLASAWAYERFASFRLVALYVDEPLDAPWLDRLGARPVDRGANLWLVSPGDEGFRDGESTIDGYRCVSAVQTYLDLGVQLERSKEAAQRLRQNQLRWSRPGE